ncbi:MAG: mechanosensitive ion channel family protein [Planctomycetota bacterium]
MNGPGLLAWFLAALLIASSTGPARAQDAAQATTQSEALEAESLETAAEPVDALGRGTPRSAFGGFLLAIDERDFERAARFLEEPPFWYGRVETSSEELAKRLGFVLQRVGLVDPGGLSEAPEGVFADGQPADRETVGSITTDSGEVQIYLRRVESSDGLQVWKFGGSTVAQIPELYGRYSYPGWVEAIAQRVPSWTFLGIEAFKWVIALSVVGVVYLPLFGLSLLLSIVLTKRGSGTRKRVRRFLAFPVSSLVALAVGASVLDHLGLGLTGRKVMESYTLITALGVWALLATVGLWRDLAIKRLEQKGRVAAAIVLRPLARALQVVIVVVGVLFWLSNLGFDISTLLAGLGVGGVALALALQKPLEDIFGAVTLFSQQPLRVHDLCRVGGSLGTVEEIGLRTTRLRTLDKTVISIPNAALASQPIENISARGSIRYLQEVRLRVDTDREKLERVLGAVRGVLTSEESVDGATCRARLKELAEFAFVIEVHAYVRTTDFAVFLDHAERLTLGIIDAVHAQGASFAEPPELRPSV